MTQTAAPTATGKPRRAALVLTTLILAAGVANLNLSVANVALPDIGTSLDASQAALNLIAVGFSLGLAASVLYLGALGDRYGRKLMLVLGMVVSLPACVIAATAPTVEILFAARLLGGLGAGMAYPTTLALITALWSGRSRIAAIALWSAIGGALSSLGPLTAGAILGAAAWGWVFLMTLPLAVVTLVLVIVLVPSHVNETKDPVDNAGGVLSVVLIGSLVLGINFVVVPGMLTTAWVLFAIAVVSGVLFVLRQLRARVPLYDLHYARRRTFWVGALGGIIVFGSLMGALYIGQQYMQNVLGYSPLQSGLAILPSTLLMVVAGPVSGRLIGRYGSRATMLAGFAFCLIGFIVMWTFWDVGSGYPVVGIAYAALGIGVGLSGTPTTHSLTSSVPVWKAGMASGTADLQRDLGSSILTSILGAILTAGYAASIASSVAGAPANVQSEVTSGIETTLQKSFSSAEMTAQQYPQYAEGITSAARDSFLAGADWAYLAGMLFVVIGIAVVFFLFPKKKPEFVLTQKYEAESDAGPVAAAR
ncbi:MFS transporter [Compostimonas suwonensis]|uniref:EmrB/QacA subfamily drug resistance transporter n=1 Tax=Compostimonas suwonensis TaxID=1048394 RepID=A0A2M9BZT4_9MICO|nr:MFS transporter [Compostimonas suwonensis]PJJ63582.1 EmrB/QacA subfamily drug resistance transporter [Compostimonas suwonensis]